MAMEGDMVQLVQIESLTLAKSYQNDNYCDVNCNCEFSDTKCHCGPTPVCLHKG